MATLFTVGWVGLALAIALVSRWQVGQWQVPKARARIFLGCCAVGIRRVYRLLSPAPLILLFLFSCPTQSRETIICPRGEKLIGGIIEPYFFVLENLSGYTKGIVANVCVSAVVRFRSRVLSHDTKRGTKIKT